MMPSTGIWTEADEYRRIHKVQVQFKDSVSYLRLLEWMKQPISFRNQLTQKIRNLCSFVILLCREHSVNNNNNQLLSWILVLVEVVHKGFNNKMVFSELESNTKGGYYSKWQCSYEAVCFQSEECTNLTLHRRISWGSPY